MKAGPRSTGLLLLGMGCALAAAAQTSTPQHETTVLVVNVLPQPPQPVKSVRLSLTYLESGVTITEAQQVTNSQGQALLDVSQVAAQRGDLRVEITGAGDLVIYAPADGQLPALPATFTIRLLPKGSTALLGPPQIEAMLHRMLLQVNSLQKQVSALKAGAAPQQGQQADLGAAIAAWAQGNGFSSALVDQQVQQWATAIQSQSGQHTAEQKALAELALKHYAAAAQLFSQASDADRAEIGAEDQEELALQTQMKALRATQQALLDKRRSSLRQLLDDSQQAAGADQLSLKYHEATLALESAAAAAEAEYKKHPDDRGFHELWLQALSNAADGHRREGEMAPADQSLALLAQAVGDFQSLAAEYSALGDRPEADAAETGLGMALVREGERAGGDTAMAALEQAVQAFQRALEVRTRAELPHDWAETESDLGLALWDEGGRSTGDKAITLLSQSVQAYKRALEVRTKTDLPQEWSQTQNGLGLALFNEGFVTGGDKGMALLDESVQALRSALEVRTKADMPEYWAQTQMNLGISLWAEGERTSGEKAFSLFDQAAQAFRNALQIYTKADLPQFWAWTQSDLGNVFTDEGMRASGENAMALLDQAVQAYTHALEVDTKADLPQNWAITQSNLGVALKEEATRSTGDKAMALFDQAVEADRNVLEVYTQAGQPRYWAQTQMNLGDALSAEGMQAGGDKAIGLLDQAAQAYRSALELHIKTDNPLGCAEVQSSLGAVLLTEGELVGAARGTELLDQALQAFQESLKVYTKDDPADWATSELSIIEADLAAGRFEKCLAQTAAMTGDNLASSAIIERDSMQLACQWGAAEKSAALSTEKSLLARTSAPTAGAWNFAGLNHVLLSSPAFAADRNSWIALFDAVQNGDAAAMAASLHQLEPILQP